MEQTPNIFDLALAALLAFFTVRAMMRGFIREILGLAGVLTAIFTSAALYKDIGDGLEKLSGIPGDWWHAVAFGLILAVVFFIFSYLGSLLSRIIQNGAFSWFDRILGAATGFAKGILIAYLGINIVLLVTPFQTPEALQGSFLAPHVVRAGRTLMDFAPDNLTRTLQEKSGLGGQNLREKSLDSTNKKSPTQPKGNKN